MRRAAIAGCSCAFGVPALPCTRPGVYEIGLIGPMGSRIDMPILCGRDICVLATMFGNIPCDAFGHGVTACYAEFAAFAKSGLHIHHD